MTKNGVFRLFTKLSKLGTEAEVPGVGQMRPSSGVHEKGVRRMKNKEFARQLERRTLEFAVRVIRLSAMLPKTPEGRIVRNQITKAGTSLGANYREANRSRSSSEFRSKIRICESEASETQYWFEVITEMAWLPLERVARDSEECSEWLAMFTSIGKSL